MLFGEHAVVYDRPCLVTAVDQRMKVSLEVILGKRLEINAPDVGVVGYAREIKFLGKKPGVPEGARFLEAAVKRFFEEHRLGSGLRIETESGFSSEFGFGTSSAVTIATLQGLSELFKVKLSRRRLFDLAYQTVLDVQGVGSGFDLAVAIWGGTLYFVTGGKKIIPLKIKKLPLVIGYTGIKADTSTLVRQVARLYKNQARLVDKVFDNIALLVKEAKEALLRCDWKRLGELMNLNQGFLDGLGVNTESLSNLIFAARKAGSWGAKLSGAGGGDCMIALVLEGKEKKVAKAIEKAGGSVLKVKPGAEGVKVL